MSAPRYFADQGMLYADFGDGRCAVTPLIWGGGGYRAGWCPLPTPDAATLWPEPAPVADAGPTVTFSDGLDHPYDECSLCGPIPTTFSPTTHMRERHRLEPGQWTSRDRPTPTP